jgi:hypothetical protein
MKTEFKILIRSIASHVMTFSGVLILLWFIFVVITSVFGLRYYSGDSLEMMVFLLFMAMVVIGVSSVINISLSIDLIAEAKLNELKFTDKHENFGKKMLKWGFGVLAFLIMAVFIGDYVIHRNKLIEFKALTAKVVEAHQGNLEKFLDYLQDTSQILKTKEVLEIVNRSSDKVSRVEAILVQEILGKESVVSFSANTDSSFLVNQKFENLIIVPSEDEKQLIQELIEGEKVGVQVLELEKGKIRGYYPISKNGKAMVVRVIPTLEFSGNRR